jgi:hypothetical protein
VTGFAFDEGTRLWQPMQFRVPAQVHTIRPLTAEEQKDRFWPFPAGATWGVFEGKDPYSRYRCPDPNNDTLYCGALADHFILDLATRRYQAYYVGGYVHGRDDNDDTPSIQIGRCKEVGQ